MKRQKRHLQPIGKLRDHVNELVRRLFVLAGIFVASSILMYFIHEPIIDILRSPLGMTLYYSNPAGSFSLIIKVCLMGGLVVTLPFLTYNFMMFAQPAFPKTLSIKRVYVTAIFSAIMALIGTFFAYLVILPGTLHFLGSFQMDGLSALISANDYLSFVTNIIILFALIFQIPLIMEFINRIKPLSLKKLLKFEKWVLLASLIIALLAPFTYDLLTSLLISFPIVVLYNLSVLMVLISHVKQKRKPTAVFAKPNNTIFDLNLDESIFESLGDDLQNLEKLKAKPSVTSFANKLSKEHIVITQPPAWVLEKKKKIELINLQNRQRKLITL